MMTKDEFYNFCDINKELILSFYKNGKTPSLDRLNPNLNYSLDNIQIIDFDLNRIKDKTPESIRKSVKAAAEAKMKKVLLIKKQSVILFKSLSELCNYLKISKKVLSRYIKNGIKYNGYKIKVIGKE